MEAYFRFGEFELDTTAYVLRRGTTRVRLERLPMELLLLLVQSRGALVDRTRIHAALWGADVFVDQEAAINTAVRKLRRALNDRTEQPRFIETVVGKGYRFIGSLDETAPDVPVPFRSCTITLGRKAFVLEDGDNVVGRDPAARIHVDHPSVSRQHALIALRERQAVLRDLHSRNGTFVNGRRVDEPIVLEDGAVIAAGPVTMIFHLPAALASTRPMGSRGAPAC